MNIELLYIIGFAILALVLGFGLSILMKKYNLSTGDITNGIDLTKTITTLVRVMAKDLGFGNHEEIDKIVEIINNSLDFVKGVPNAETKEEKIDHALFYVKEMCVEFRIDLNEDRLMIVSTLLMLAFNVIEAVEKK